MTADELALETLQTNRSIVRRLHYLGAELPQDKLGDFMLPVSVVQTKNMKIADALIRTASDSKHAEGADKKVAQHFI